MFGWLLSSFRFQDPSVVAVLFYFKNYFIYIFLTLFILLYFLSTVLLFHYGITDQFQLPSAQLNSAGLHPANKAILVEIVLEEQKDE